MNIEFNQILTFVSVVAAVYFAFKSNSRANNDEVSKKAQVDAILSQKLDSISDDTKEIRKEITDVKVKVSRPLTMYPNSSERKSRSCWRNNHAVAHFAMAQQEGGEKHGCYLCGTHCQG